MMLSAYIDESDAGDRHGISFVAGLIAPATTWCGISAEWVRVCNEPPRIPYYKCSAIKSEDWARKYGLRPCDVGIKTDGLSALLFPTFDFDPRVPPLAFRASSSLQGSDFETRIKSRLSSRARKKTGYQWLTSPYYFCFVHIVRNVLWHVRHLAVDYAAQLSEEITKVDFYVDKDKHGLSRHAVELFLALKANAPETVQELMGTCEPLDDKDSPAIQAADMLAGQLMQYQREWQRRGVSNPPRFSSTQSRITSISSVESEWTGDKLQHFAGSLSALPERDWVRRIMSEPNPSQKDR